MKNKNIINSDQLVNNKRIKQRHKDEKSRAIKGLPKLKSKHEELELKTISRTNRIEELKLVFKLEKKLENTQRIELIRLIQEQKEYLIKVQKCRSY